MQRIKIPKQLRFLPPIFIFALTILFVYLCIKDCFLTLISQNYFNIVILLWSFFSFSLVMWLWGFFSLMFGDPGTIEKEKKYCPEAKCNVRCISCKSYKPYRTHHCSTCGKCYARMDHHCIALGRCVALRNHKTFFVFMFHGINMCFLWFVSTVLTMSLCHFDEKPRIFNVHVLASLSLTGLLGFLLYEEFSSLLRGETTFEKLFNIHIDQKKTALQNAEEIMGPFGYGWLIPTQTPTTTNAYQWEYLRNNEE